MKRAIVFLGTNLSDYLRTGCVLTLIFLLYNCSSESNEEQAKAKEKSVEQIILDFSQEWMGTPYQIGGTTKEGIDCSAFTQVVYREAFEIDLPRRVRDQRKVGEVVAADSMKPGDLVVFKTGVFFTNKQHIGIYLSDNKFIHASSSKGVTISSLEESYWKKKYRSSRRLMNESGDILETSVASQ